MRLHVPTRIVLTLLLILSISPLVLAHPGGMDSYGGHNDRGNGGYHFHRGPLAGESFQSKQAALEALRTQQSGPSQATANVVPTTPVQASELRALPAYDLEALIRLLIAKGIITEDELRAAAAGSSQAAAQASTTGPSSTPATPSSAVAGTTTGETTASGQPIYVGPRGGRYHYSASGKKVYERHRR